ncbi:Metastasis-Associated In Colon Cancer Protein 1 [Manis pentadactyla]|nr:Metastasis-Associated In Colon Cancer Protein 1 [Manis pentadactyla]
MYNLTCELQSSQMDDLMVWSWGQSKQAPCHCRSNQKGRSVQTPEAWLLVHPDLHSSRSSVPPFPLRVSCLSQALVIIKKLELEPIQRNQTTCHLSLMLSAALLHLVQNSLVAAGQTTLPPRHLGGSYLAVH